MSQPRQLTPRDRTFVFGSLPVVDLKAVKNYFAVTLNDLVVALPGGPPRSRPLPVSPG